MWRNERQDAKSPAVQANHWLSFWASSSSRFSWIQDSTCLKARIIQDFRDKEEHDWFGDVCYEWDTRFYSDFAMQDLPNVLEDWYSGKETTTKLHLLIINVENSTHLDLTKVAHIIFPWPCQVPFWAQHLFDFIILFLYWRQVLKAMIGIAISRIIKTNGIAGLKKPMGIPLLFTLNYWKKTISWQA